MDGVDEFVLIAGIVGGGAIELRSGGNALVFVGGDEAREDGFGDGGGGDAEVDGGLTGPDAGAFLAGLVEDDIDHGFLGLGVVRKGG